MGAYINPPGKSWIVARPNESVWDLVGDLRDKHINEMFEYFDLRFGAWKGPHDEGFPVECTLYSRLEQKSCAFLFHYQGAEEGPYVPIPLLHGAKSKCYNIRDFKQKSPRGYVEVPRRSSEAEAMPFLFRHFEREPLPGWKKPPTQGREEDDKTYLFLSLRVQGQTEIELFEQESCRTTRDSMWLNPTAFEDWEHSGFAETDEERVATLKALTSRDTPGIITSKIIDLALKNTGVFWSESSEGIEEIRKQIQTFLHKESGSLLRLPWPDPCGTEQTSVARGVKSIRIRSLTPTEIEFLRMDEKERATWQKEKAEDAESQGAMVIPIVNVTKAVKNNKMALKASALDKMSFRNFALSFDFLLTEKQNTNLVYFQKDVKAKDKMGQDVMLKEFFTVLVEASGKFKVS
uniref:Uncharacterized protein n=1 Tax=Chromera velia CCMP2878 TaxID=1169474 RepID=A0A0G4F3K4_9ALVE|eukprot:Cvel_2688.t1-p1 / transcript=Cvel_2688.t1 / gene=Cvel_2688 / organism=Chromera_velia_CCMP2878 / gene_product=hypothetical protein / transcript_product=hypothetical protein / location=Cvel_scaffold107:106753-113398(-) / protein_length=404 / sequence_SO=supercontig / SO=protein_coding / is_pseudo=false